MTRERKDSTDSLEAEMGAVNDSIAPSASGPCRADQEAGRQERLISAWNRMAAANVDVVRTIKKNERRQWRATLAVWIAVAAALIGAFYLAVEAENAINRLATTMLAEQRAELVKMTKKQDATLTAVLKLGEALSRKIEADAQPGFTADGEVEVAALDAQKAALEAQKEVATSAVVRDKADKAIKRVEQKAAGVEKKAAEDKERWAK